MLSSVIFSFFYISVCLLTIFVINQYGLFSKSRDFSDTLCPSVNSTITKSIERYNQSYNVNRNSVIFITDGAAGTARDVIPLLLDNGFYVLVGVKTDDELRSFAYEKRKGLEVIIFDMNSPATLAKVLYRLREIKRDYHRMLSGIVINQLHALQDISISSKTCLNPLQRYDYDSDLLEKVYNRLIRGPYRMLQGFEENFLIESNEHRRILFLINSKNPYVEGIPCSNHLKQSMISLQSLFGVTMETFIEQLQIASNNVMNTTVSAITWYDDTIDPVDGMNKDIGGWNNLSPRSRHQQMIASSWNELINGEESESTIRDTYSKKFTKASIVLKAILHAMISPHPRYVYPLKA